MVKLTLSAGQFFSINIDDILQYIVNIVDNWEVLGMYLNLPHHILAEIRANNPHNIVACKEQMISKWMYEESLATPSCWWSLVKAAKDMDETVIANKLKKITVSVNFGTVRLVCDTGSVHNICSRPPRYFS